MTTRAAGLVLAAGAGSRMGTPKVLVEDWLARSVQVLRAGGCAQVFVTLGAARPDVPPPAVAIVVGDWESGLAASVRAGLAAAQRFPQSQHAVIMTVDTPDIPAAAVARVLAAARTGESGLARAVYHGRPGHPVVLRRDHWAQAAASAHGDAGLRDYLITRPTELVECADLATGEDVDTPKV